MQAINTLRIDSGDGSFIDYRIADDSVEMHRCENGPWQRLTPEQLTAQITTNRTLAYWLRRRMGVHWVVRACNQDLMAA